MSAIVVSAHLDSVFSEETDVTVKERDGVYYGPGITDDARGLAALLSVIRAFQHTGIQTEAPIVFLATVGEEGPGDLRGVKAFIDGNANIASFISIDSVSPEEIIYQGTGSFRYEVTFSGTGAIASSILARRALFTQLAGRLRRLLRWMCRKRQKQRLMLV